MQYQSVCSSWADALIQFTPSSPPTMAPKKDSKGNKGKGKDASDAGDKGKGGKGGLKPANSINVRHILVRFSTSLYSLQRKSI